MDKFKTEYAQTLRTEAAKLKALASRTSAMAASDLMNPQLAATLQGVLLDAAACLDSTADAVLAKSEASNL